MFDLEKTEAEIMNLFALINAIKTSAENLENTEDSETILNLSDIAKDKLSNVWKDVSEIEMPDSIDAESENGFEDKTLAALIASVLAHPDIPDELFHAVVLGLDEIADIGRFKTLRKIENSPEYISKILTDYEEAQSK